MIHEAKRNNVSAYHVARVYAGLGDAGHALSWLQNAERARDERMVMIRVDPKLDTLRSNARFIGLLRKLGLQDSYDPERAPAVE